MLARFNTPAKEDNNHRRNQRLVMRRAPSHNVAFINEARKAVAVNLCNAAGAPNNAAFICKRDQAVAVLQMQHFWHKRRSIAELTHLSARIGRAGLVGRAV